MTDRRHTNMTPEQSRAWLESQSTMWADALAEAHQRRKAMKPTNEQIDAAASRAFAVWSRLTFPHLGDAYPKFATASAENQMVFRAFIAAALEGFVPSVVEVQNELAPLMVSFSRDVELTPCFVTIRIGSKEQMLSVAGWNRLKWRVDNLIGQNSEGSVTADTDDRSSHHRRVRAGAGRAADAVLSAPRRATALRPLRADVPGRRSLEPRRPLHGAGRAVREDRFDPTNRRTRIVGSPWGDIIVPAAHRATKPYEKDRWEFRFPDDELLWHAAGSPGFKTFEKEENNVVSLPEMNPETPPTDLSWIRENLVQAELDLDLLHCNPDLVEEAMRHFVVLRAEHRLDTNAIHYVLAAKRFPKKPRHAMLPRYTIKVTWHMEDILDEEKKEKIGMRRVITDLEFVPLDG